MAMVDDEVSRLWGLLTELSNQLSENREHAEKLRAHIDELKARAVHAGAGFALRRFNTDITKEAFESEIERFNAHLVVENQTLQYENKQLSMLLKEYETTMDGIMAKFRSFAHSTQQHELDSARHYETLLLQHSGSSALAINGIPQASEPMSAMPRMPGSGSPFFSDPLSTQMSLAHLSSLLRRAMRSLQGEDTEDSSSSDDDEDDSSSSSSNGSSDARRRLAVPIGGSSDSAAGSTLSEQHAGSFQRASSHASSNGTKKPRYRARLDSKYDRSEGGYLRLLNNDEASGRLLNRADKALARETELKRLERENRELRELLGIASELPAPLEEAGSTSTAHKQGGDASSAPTANPDGPPPPPAKHSAQAS